jgi:3-oxoacyl-[acyl-carrier protein] reductase
MKTILITGASRGIGAAIAKKYFDSGYMVFGTSTSGKVCDHTNHTFMVDFADPASLEKFVDRIKLLAIDVLVNNAGINKPAPFLDISAENFNQTYQVNLFAPFRVCQAVLPGMVKQQYGRIINISSIWGKVSRPNVAAYSASKFGIDGMTLSLANEHAKDNVLANCVSPGFIDTEMTRKNLSPDRMAQFNALTPVGRLGTAQEIADLVYFLGSDQNTFISGQNIACDGGFTRA